MWAERREWSMLSGGLEREKWGVASKNECVYQTDFREVKWRKF